MHVPHLCAFRCWVLSDFKACARRPAATITHFARCILHVVSIRFNDVFSSLDKFMVKTNEIIKPTVILWIGRLFFAHILPGQFTLA